MCFMQVFEAFYANSGYLNLMCYTDPLSLCQPTAILSTDGCSVSCQGKIIPMDSRQEPGWGLCSGLTVASSSYISPELELSGSLPIRIYLSSCKTKRREKAWLPIFLIYKSTPIWGGEDFINLILGYDIW